MSTSFARVNFPTQHPAAGRAQRPFGALLRVIRSADGSRAAPSLLLAAMVSALVVVANQVVDTWTEGHLLAAWIVLWTVAFASLALLTTPARRAATAFRAALTAWNARRLQAAQDDQYWQSALNDARIMADISRAMSSAALHDTKAYN